jgi:glycosyltransferase involved in cell wall biosynthesis
MPTLGQRLQTLRQSIASVARQTGVAARLAVVVPEGAEEARAIAHSAGATVLDDPRRGLSAAVNAGVSARRGEEFYAWLNDDDYFLADGLSRLVSLLQARPDAVVAYGGCVYVDEMDRRIGVSNAGDLAHRIQPWGPNLVPQPSSVTRLDAMAAAGPYDEDLRFAMDLDMFLRLRRQGAFVSTRDEVAAFRWHAESLTVGDRKLQVSEAQQVKRRYLGPRARRVSPVWDLPVRWATQVAGTQVGRRARRIAASS